MKSNQLTVCVPAAPTFSSAYLFLFSCSFFLPLSLFLTSSHSMPSMIPSPCVKKAVAFAGTCLSQLFEQCAPQSLCSEGFAALRLETFG